MSGNWLIKVKKKGFIAGTPILCQSTKIYHIINEIKHDSILYQTLNFIIQSQTSTEDESNLKSPSQTHNITIFQYDH